MKQNPEDSIQLVKGAIKDLSTVQDECFKELVEVLTLNQEGDEWLFDYVFNCTEDITFEKYISNYGIEYKDLVIN